MEKLTVPKLKDLLRQRGLACSGLKVDLLKRLLEAESSEAKGAGAEGEEPAGGATEDGRKRKADVLGRGGRRKSKPTHGFMSGGSDDSEEEEKAAGDTPARKSYKEEAAGENSAKKTFKEEAALNDSREKMNGSREKNVVNDSIEKATEQGSREKAVEKGSREKNVEKGSREKAAEKGSREKNVEKGSREVATNEEDKQENKDFEKFKADGWCLGSLDKYKHSNRSTEDLATEGLKNFKAFKASLDSKLTSNSYTKITSVRESLAESSRFYMAAIEAAKKVDKAEELLTAGRNVIACLSHLIKYVGVKEACDITVVAAETVAKVCREVHERVILQGSGQAGRRGLLEVWTSLIVNLVEQAGQLQTREVVSRLEQVASGLDKWSQHAGHRAALAILRLHFGQFLLPWAIGAVVEHDFLIADRILQDIGQFMMEPSKGALTCLAKVFPSLQPAAQQWGQLEQELQHYRVLKDSLHLHSMGVSQLEKALQGQEELSMDLAWFAHDQLKEAAAGVSGVDSEMYCLASTSLARFYMKVVKTPDNREKGTRLLRKILQEAQCLPGNLHTRDWWRTATGLMEDIQADSMAIEDAAWTEARAAAAPFVNRQLKEIKEADSTMNDLEFCNFVVLQYPPVHKTKEQYQRGFPEDNSDYDWGDVLKKLLGLYHPDKIDVQIWGSGHKVICEEIAKYLNVRFTSCKW